MVHIPLIELTMSPPFTVMPLRLKVGTVETIALGARRVPQIVLPITAEVA